MPDNVWLGVTMTNDFDGRNLDYLNEVDAKIKFVSIEPFLSPLSHVTIYELHKFDWVIIGRLTGYGNKHDPDISWITDIVKGCVEDRTKVFLKNNLKSIWGENLIQEFPNERNA